MEHFDKENHNNIIDAGCNLCFIGTCQRRLVVPDVLLVAVANVSTTTGERTYIQCNYSTIIVTFKIHKCKQNNNERQQ